MTMVCIHQPDFIPWIGFFDRLIRSDIFIILDNVQFLRRGWHHRDKIKTAHGPMWLTVPVRKKGRYTQLINQVEIDDSRNWREEHLRSLQTWYGRAPYFSTYFPRLWAIYGMNHRLLVDLNVALLEFLMEAFNIEIKREFASSLNVTGRGTELLVNLVRAVGGDTYLTGLGARDYLDESRFAQARIAVFWQDFIHPEYRQLHGDFVANLSSLDLLFNCGTHSQTILRRERIE